jgi:purine-nucleoside phosphorylase
LPQDFTPHSVNPLSALWASTATPDQQVKTDNINPLTINPNTITPKTITHVAGHKGQVLQGELNGQPVIVIAGRYHLYQGFNAFTVTEPIRWLAAQGVKRVILTNAAGAINPSFAPGHLMVITDHLNLTGQSPLSGPGNTPVFIDTQTLYHPGWAQQVTSLVATMAKGLTLHHGIYAGVLGPQYETPAEVRMLATMGADAVGMSTVLEALQAHALHMPVLGLSMLSNMAAGLSTSSLSHQEVLAILADKQAQLAQLLTHIITTA